MLKKILKLEKIPVNDMVSGARAICNIANVWMQDCSDHSMLIMLYKNKHNMAPACLVDSIPHENHAPERKVFYVLTLTFSISL